MAAKKKTELAAQQKNVPAFLQERMNDTRGSEDVGADDLTIPRLDLVQSLSKCRKKSDPAYIEGCEEGQLYNNLTRELYGESVNVIPVMFRKEYLLWRDQDLGGGFGGSYPSESEAKTALAEQEKPEEWEVVDTHQHFCLLVKDDGTMEEIVLSMAKSKAKVSRKWNSLIRLNGGPRFSRVYSLEGVDDENSAGQDFYNLMVKNVGFVTEEQFVRAEQLYEVVKSGKAKADTSTDFDHEDETGEM